MGNITNTLGIYSLIKEGKAKINCRGHFGLDYYDQQNESGTVEEAKFKRSFIQRFIDTVEKDIADSEGANDGNWGKYDKEERTPEWHQQRNVEMRQFYKYRLENNIVYPQDSDGHFFGYYHDVHCPCCGKISFGIFNGELTFSTTWDKKGVPFRDDCPMKGISEYKGDFNVISDLLVTNFFANEDTPPDMKYADEYGLNYDLGVYNIVDYKIKNENIVYAQTGNSSVDVFISPDEKEIVFLDCVDEYKDYKYLGDVSMGVWRRFVCIL